MAIVEKSGQHGLVHGILSQELHRIQHRYQKNRNSTEMESDSETLLG